MLNCEKLLIEFDSQKFEKALPTRLLKWRNQLIKRIEKEKRNHIIPHILKDK